MKTKNAHFVFANAFLVHFKPITRGAGAAGCSARAAQASAGAFICVRGRHFGGASGRRGRLGMGALALKNVHKIFSFLPVDGGIRGAWRPGGGKPFFFSVWLSLLHQRADVCRNIHKKVVYKGRVLSRLITAANVSSGVVRIGHVAARRTCTVFHFSRFSQE